MAHEDCIPGRQPIKASAVSSIALLATNQALPSVGPFQNGSIIVRKFLFSGKKASRKVARICSSTCLAPNGQWNDAPCAATAQFERPISSVVVSLSLHRYQSTFYSVLVCPAGKVPSLRNLSDVLPRQAYSHSSMNNSSAFVPICGVPVAAAAKSHSVCGARPAPFFSSMAFGAPLPARIPPPPAASNVRMEVTVIIGDSEPIEGGKPYSSLSNHTFAPHMLHNSNLRCTSYE